VFPKVVFLILSVGAVAAAQLGIRTARLQLANASARATERVEEHDKTLWRLRSEIASRITPEQVEHRVLALGPLRPVSPERYIALVRLETQAALKTAITAKPIDDTDR